MILANTTGSHAYRYAMIGGIMLLSVIVFVSRLVGHRGKSNPAAKAADAIEAATKRLRLDLDSHNKVMKRERQQLDSIRTIPDEVERLNQLAHFANRKRQRKS